MCKDIIGKLLKNKRAWPFEEPVDPKALKLVCSPPPDRNSRCQMRAMQEEGAGTIAPSVL